MTIALDEYLSVAGETVVATVRSAGTTAPLWDRLAAHATWLCVEHTGGEADAPVRTDLRAHRAQGAIAFVGEIEQRQLEPLVETLRALATGSPEFDTPATPARLAELVREVELVVVVSPTCPFCPRVAAQALRFACASARVNVTVLRADSGLAPSGVQSVPSVLVDGALVATGSVGEYELLERVLRRARGDEL